MFIWVFIYIYAMREVKAMAKNFYFVPLYVPVTVLKTQIQTASVSMKVPLFGSWYPTLSPTQSFLLRQWDNESKLK